MITLCNVAIVLGVLAAAYAVWQIYLNLTQPVLDTRK